MAVTDRRAAGARSILEAIRSAISAGADLIQIRERDLGGAELLRLTRDVLETAKEAGGRCRILVNDRLDVALSAKASGVHLPSQGLPIGLARRHVPKKFQIGRSVHSLSEARLAEKEGADYLVFGPIFQTPGKEAFGPPAGPAGLLKVAEAVHVPVWAIGGVNPETAAELRGLPIAGVAAIRALLGAPDPAAALAALRSALDGAGRS
jgi:thiamine-phosphate pyrophosphorylase